MATESFYETMVIDTPEAGANLAKSIEHYERYGPYLPKKVQGTTEDHAALDRIMGVFPRFSKFLHIPIMPSRYGELANVEAEIPDVGILNSSKPRKTR